MTSVPAGSTADREIVLSRVFDAPRELVFDAWTDSKHVAEWWGPNGLNEGMPAAATLFRGVG
jgi:uncharacterized protein YndB with AHSA1/START domain